VSTYWGYVCESHDPPLASEHWFNHGEDTLAALVRAVRNGSWPVDEIDEPAPVDHMGYATSAPVRWLREHPRCTIALHNEYGATKPIEETP
jgi:hypothetical protein